MRLKWLAVAGLGLAACGPTEREVGVSVLAAMPAILVAGWVLQLLYRLAWKTIETRELPRFDFRPTAALVGVTVILGVCFARDISDDAILAFLLVGASYATFLIIAMRATVRSALFSWCALLPWLLQAPLAVGLAVFGSTTSEAGLSLAYYLLPGYAGLICGGLYALLFIEVLIRLYIKRQRARESEPVFPEARIHDE